MVQLWLPPPGAADWLGLTTFFSCYRLKRISRSKNEPGEVWHGEKEACLEALRVLQKKHPDIVQHVPGQNSENPPSSDDPWPAVKVSSNAKTLGSSSGGSSSSSSSGSSSSSKPLGWEASVSVSGAPPITESLENPGASVAEAVSVAPVIRRGRHGLLKASTTGSNSGSSGGSGSNTGSMTPASGRYACCVPGCCYSPHRAFNLAGTGGEVPVRYIRDEGQWGLQFHGSKGAMGALWREKELVKMLKDNKYK